MKKSTMKKYETGGQKNPNSGKFETAMGVVTRKPGSKGSGGANKGSEMSSSKVAGKGTKSRATSSGGVNTPPAGANPGRKMSSSTTFSKSPTNQANRGLMKKGGAAKMMKKGGSTKKK